MKDDKPKPPAKMGRPSVQGAGQSPVLQLRVSEAIKGKVKRNGAQWARDALENAPEALDKLKGK